MTFKSEWYENRVQLWQNLRDALNALEDAGERPDLNVVERDGDVVHRQVFGENALVVHCDDGRPWALDVYLNAFAPDAYRPGQRVAYEENGGTVVNVVPADDQVSVERLDVQWDNGDRSTVWVSDLLLEVPPPNSPPRTAR